MVDLRAPILAAAFDARVAVPFGRHVVADVAVDAEHLLLRRLALEVGEVRRARLFGARAAARHVDRALVAGDDERLSRRLRRHVLTQVAVGAFALDDQRLDSENPVASSERRRRIVDDLLFRVGLAQAMMRPQAAAMTRKVGRIMCGNVAPFRRRWWNNRIR